MYEKIKAFPSQSSTGKAFVIYVYCFIFIKLYMMQYKYTFAIKLVCEIRESKEMDRKNNEI